MILNFAYTEFKILQMWQFYNYTYISYNNSCLTFTTEVD